MRKLFFGLLVVLFLSCGCAAGISTMQEQELNAYESKGLLVEEKSPAAAAGLGILPGGGSFYTRNYGLGVVNLLFWPVSILWDPISGYNGAQNINYYATKTYVKKSQKKEMQAIDRQMEEGTIDRDQYLKKKKEIEDKYLSESPLVFPPDRTWTGIPEVAPTKPRQYWICSDRQQNT